MADRSEAGFGKDPLVASHGDALADQSFQSLKSKEVRDSLSPTEMKFRSMALNNPNTTGWNVQSSKEVSPDGKGFRSEILATTDGVENINGGTAEFKGRNEHLSSAHHQGDDKNFVKKAMESSSSHLQEKVVMGDENYGLTEVRTSSSKSTSSSQVIKSSTNVEYDDGYPIEQQSQPQEYLMDSSRLHQPHLQLQRQQLEQERLLEEQRIYEQQFQQQHQQHINQQERRTTEQMSTMRENTQQKNISQNIETEEKHEQNKRYVDMDKASPEYQQHVQYLMQQPGKIISNTVEYLKPNVKMITTVKRLPDGTIVRNKRYETEEPTPTASSTRPTPTAKNETQSRRDYQPDKSSHARPSHDMVDSSSPARYVQDTHANDIETKLSSSHKYVTETTSETVKEYDDHHTFDEPSSRSKPKQNDFTTHGFPSVRSNKPTQEYPTERPKNNYPSHSTPSIPNEAVVPHYTDDTDNISERRVNTKDGEVIIVSSEKKSNFKTSSNSERIVETEYVVRDDQMHSNKRPQDFTTHGFPSVREPGSQQPKNYSNEHNVPSDKLPPIYPSVMTPSRPAAGLPSSHNQHSHSPRKPTSQDYSTQGFPSVRVPSNVDEGRPNGTTESPRATPTSKTPSRTPSPGKYKSPNTSVRETTERYIRKEKETDSSHRAFAASLRSSSPFDHSRRENYTTDSHNRHTPRSSISSSRTFRREMREGSHDSAPSETSRISNATRNTPPRATTGRTGVTRNVTSSRSTKSPSPGKSFTTTTTHTTNRTLTNRGVPKVTGSPDNHQHSRITRTTNKTDTIFPINEPLTSSITKINFSDNHKQPPHKQNKQNFKSTKNSISSASNNKNMTPIAASVTASASNNGLEEVIEPLCIKKYYSKLGPSAEQTKPAELSSTATTRILKGSQFDGKTRRSEQK